MTSIDMVFVPAIIFLWLYDPNFIYSSSARSILLHLEAGQYLGAISRIFHGEIPYKDFFILYGPFSFYLPAMVMAIFSQTIDTLRGYFYLTSIGSVVIGYYLAHRCLATRLFLYLTAFILVLATFDPIYAPRWGGMRSGLGILALLCLLGAGSDRRSTVWLFGAGMTSATALFFSIEIGIASLLAAGAFFHLQKVAKASAGLTRNEYIASFAGFCSIVIPFSLYLLAKGAFFDYLVVTFIDIPFNFFAAFGQFSPLFGQETTATSLKELHASLMSLGCKRLLPGLIYFFTIVSVFVFHLKHEEIPKRLAQAYLLAFYGLPLYLLAFRGIRGPQFDLAAGPSIIIGFMFLESRWHILKNSFSHQPEKSHQSVRMIVASWLLLICGLYYSLFSDYRLYGSVRSYWRYKMDRFMRLETISSGLSRPPLQKAGRILLPEEQAREITEVTQYVLANTKEREPIFVFPDMGFYYFLTDRPGVSRFHIALQAYMTSKYREELISDLTKAGPRYVIATDWTRESSILAKSISKNDVELLPEVVRFIMDHYHLEESFGTTLILRHNQTM